MYHVHVEPPVDLTDTPDQRYPLIFFLHGAGEDGVAGGRSPVQQVTRHGPWRSHGCTGYRKGPQAVVEIGRFFVAAPHLPGGEWDNGLLLRAFESVARGPVYGGTIDQTRCYLTGVSKGGHAALQFAIAYPRLFAAVVPVCPYAAARLGTGIAALADVPVWFFHGSLDGRENAADPKPNRYPANSRQLYDQLPRPGNGLSVIPGVGHSVWTVAYDTPHLYRWLLEQRLPGDPAVGPAASTDAPVSG